MAMLNQARILLVDDDPNFQRVTAFTLMKAGAEVTSVSSANEALEAFGGGPFDLILSDVKMPGMDGLQLLAEIRAVDTQVPVILITGHGDVEMAVEALQSGANDFLTKPFDGDRLKKKIDRALRLPRLERENRALREALADRHTFGNIIGSSNAMRQLFERMRRVVHRDATVLILGESGTGKELVAQAIHYAGPRSDGHFVAVNCAAIPPTLLESELFGHVKGAFTGADRAREGRFALASGGTLFLDEIGDMPLELQAKLLRVIQERRVEPVGSNQSTSVDIRLIAATNMDLAKLVHDGEFREDLYYRLSVVPLHLPPLRDRREDIPLLVTHFLKKFGTPNVVVDREAIDLLMAGQWRGNVRELENVIERALALRASEDRITLQDVEPQATPGPGTTCARFDIPDEGIVLDEVEKQLIERALHKTGNNQTRAAQLLGISRQKLIYRMQKFGIS